MEVIGDYEIPDSWEAKGMDWDDPDPTNVDYIMAIREALLERYAALHSRWEDNIFRISPWKTVSRESVRWVLKALLSMCGSFVDLGWERFKDDWSDFPKRWTYTDLVNERDRRLFDWAKHGSLVRGGGAWLRAIKNAIDSLTVIPANNVFGSCLVRFGDKHDPPFDEAIGTAMEKAMDECRDELLNGRFPTSIYAWSGNTHWKWPDPDYKGDNPERDNVDGYCGYAESQSYRIKAARNWLLGAEFDILAAVIAKAPEDPVPYSVQLDTSVFDGGRTGFKEGLNWMKRIRVKDPAAVDFVLGDPETIPRNEVVPVSEVIDKNEFYRHSAKRGWVGTVYGFFDYGVEGGFRFRSKEG